MMMDMQLIGNAHGRTCELKEMTAILNTGKAMERKNKRKEYK